jgi:hypothetical protein
MKIFFNRVPASVVVTGVLTMMTASLHAQTVDRRQQGPEPAKIEGAGMSAAPSDAIVLFDGSNLDAWVTAGSEEPASWLIEDGVTTVTPGSRTIKTKQAFGDIQLHLEWRPTAVIEGSGQSRGNSGIFLQSIYEVQILDSWENPTYVNGQAGSIYLQHPPLVNAAKPPGDWQSYDIIFKAPVFVSNGKLRSPAYVTVIHNGVVVQNNVELQGATYTPMPEVWRPLRSLRTGARAGLQWQDATHAAGSWSGRVFSQYMG